ncbi:MAG TPA: hypothetical protein VGE36_00095 [Roseateles sp.]
MKPISEARRKLLVQLESIVGNEFYNGNIQNYGPGGVREAEGRALRYPIVFREQDGAKKKIRSQAVPGSVQTQVILSGHYVLGANQLDIMAALNRVLAHLEATHGLSIEPSPEAGPSWACPNFCV